MYELTEEDTEEEPFKRRLYSALSELKRGECGSRHDQPRASGVLNFDLHSALQWLHSGVRRNELPEADGTLRALAIRGRRIADLSRQRVGISSNIKGSM